MTTTFERLQALLVRDYGIAPDAMTLQAPLDGLGLDSLGVAELLFNIEDEFRVAVPAEPVPLATVGDVVDFIDGLVAAQHGAAADGARMPAAGAP